MKKDTNLSRKSVVSLKYKKGNDSAPKITAKGKGWVAEKIIKMAHENKISDYFESKCGRFLIKKNL